MSEFIKPEIKLSELGNYGHYNSALKSIRSVWEQFQSGGDVSSGAVYVELFPHGNLAYLISNILIAKYLSIASGKRLVVLRSEEPLFIRNRWSEKDIDRLVEAFLVDEQINLKSTGAPVNSPEHRLGAAAKDVIEAAERRVSGTRYYGLEDRIRRRFLLPSIKDITSVEGGLDDELRRHFSEIAAIDAIKFRSGDFFICGHLEYDPYRYVALSAVRAKATVIYNWALQPFTLKVFNKEHEVIHQRSDSFVEQFEQVYSDFSGSERTFDLVSSLYSRALGRVRPTKVSESLGRGDYSVGVSQKCLIMAQALSDGVHSYGPLLFDDFASWIETTIAEATAAGIDVEFRDHPMQDSYDQTGFMAQMVNRFEGNSHFAVSDGSEPVNPGEYSLAITGQGTPGIEMPIAGLRTMAFANARYSGLGIVDEPESVKQYLEILTGSHKLSKGELMGRKRRAALFGFMELYSSRIDSLFFPNRLRGVPSEVLKPFAEKFSLDSVFMDPLFIAMNKVADGKKPVQDDLLTAVQRRPLGRGYAKPFEAPSTSDSVSVEDSKREQLQKIGRALAAARNARDDEFYVDAVYSAFFDLPPPEAWTVGAYKCMGRPWGRRRLIRHAYDHWASTKKSKIEWGELARAIKEASTSVPEA